MSEFDVEIITEEKKTKRGRPSLSDVNRRRGNAGKAPILPTPPKPVKRKSNAILPNEKKARHQEILAQMLGKKSKLIVQKVLNKALDDNDKDQMACLQLVMDRVIPKDYMAKNTKSGAIQIQIMGVDTKVETVETVDAEFEEVDG